MISDSLTPLWSRNCSWLIKAGPCSAKGLPHLLHSVLKWSVVSYLFQNIWVIKSDFQDKCFCSIRKGSFINLEAVVLCFPQGKWHISYCDCHQRDIGKKVSKCNIESPFLWHSICRERTSNYCWCGSNNQDVGVASHSNSRKLSQQPSL